MGWKKSRIGELAKVVGRIGLGFIAWKLLDEAMKTEDIELEREGGPEERLAREVLDLAREQGQSIAVAESCTGGLLGGALSAIPGSSLVFRGGVIAYQNEIKRDVLGVSGEDLDNPGPVSKTVAEQMALGVQEKFGAHIGISITGFAGPKTLTEPSGLVWIGIANARLVNSKKYDFKGNRSKVREQAVIEALRILKGHLT